VQGANWSSKHDEGVVRSCFIRDAASKRCAGPARNRLLPAAAATTGRAAGMRRCFGSQFVASNL
jgi:hypothetical protein